MNNDIGLLYCCSDWSNLTGIRSSCCLNRPVSSVCISSFHCHLIGYQAMLYWCAFWSQQDTRCQHCPHDFWICIMSVFTTHYKCIMINPLTTIIILRKMANLHQNRMSQLYYLNKTWWLPSTCSYVFANMEIYPNHWLGNSFLWKKPMEQCLWGWLVADDFEDQSDRTCH